MHNELPLPLHLLFTAVIARGRSESLRKPADVSTGIQYHNRTFAFRSKPPQVPAAAARARARSAAEQRKGRNERWIRGFIRRAYAGGRAVRVTVKNGGSQEGGLCWA